MIISRTPLRISFVGGGSDLRSFYIEEPGKVLSTTIDKYIYVLVKRQLGIVEFKYRINWSQVEFRNRIEDIEHPIVREALKLFEIDFPIEINTFTDVPGNTGLGSSSAFAVGLVHALHALKGQQVTKHTLASNAARVEVDILKRIMGKQDHFASAYGNLNVFTFFSDEKVMVEPVFYTPEVRQTLEKNLLLFFTGFKRDASEVLRAQNRVTSNKRAILRQMTSLVEPLREILSSGDSMNRFGELLHEGWELKRSITDSISSQKIDGYYRQARDAGAIGGKLLGAGGGGFLLFCSEPQRHTSIIQALKKLYHLPICFDDAGSRITYYSP